MNKEIFVFTKKEIYGMVVRCENSAVTQMWDNSDPVLVSGAKKIRRKNDDF